MHAPKNVGCKELETDFLLARLHSSSSKNERTIEIEMLQTCDILCYFRLKEVYRGHFLLKGKDKFHSLEWIHCCMCCLLCVLEYGVIPVLCRNFIKSKPQIARGERKKCKMNKIKLYVQKSAKWFWIFERQIVKKKYIFCKNTKL